MNIVQVSEVCLAANRQLIVKRARFSALIHGDLTRAVQNLVPPDSAASAAVDARQEIDLRIGASFTRFQTLLLQVYLFPLFLTSQAACRRVHLNSLHEQQQNQTLCVASVSGRACIQDSRQAVYQLF